MRQFWMLFTSFFKIGIFTFGGGYAMIPLIRDEMMERRKWIEEKEFLDLLTLAQSAPGPIALNTSVFVGYKVYGYAGALAAALGVIVPSFSIILFIALFFADIRENPVVDAAFKGMRPAVVALIIGPVISLAKGMHKGMFGVIIITAFVIWGLRLSPIYVLLAGAGGGIMWMLFLAKKFGR